MRLIQAGTTDQSIIVRALTSAGATATPAYGDAGITCTYKRDATGTATAITPATQTSTGAHSDGGFVHIGGGVCRLDLPDAAVADGATRVTVTINATAWVGFTEEVLLVDYDPTGPVTADVTKWNGTAVASPHTAGYPAVTIKDGTGTGELDTNAGAVVNVTNVATLTTYTGNTVQTGDAFARIGAAGAGLTAVVAASVTGAVGSVTGNVGGNVTGSVGSVAAGGITAASLATGAVDADALAADAVAEIQSGLATAADQATLLSRIGAWTGSGVNTVLGAFKAALSKTASTPSDIGGTFDPTTDSTEAIRDRGDTAWGGAGGLTAAEVWAYNDRRLTQSAAQVTAIVAHDDITVLRGDTIGITITGLGSLAGRQEIWFTVKGRTSDTDAAARIGITETDGLVVLNRAPYGTPAHGSIVVDDENAGDITISLDAIASALLPTGRTWSYDIQVKQADDSIWTPTIGHMRAVDDATHSTG